MRLNRQPAGPTCENDKSIKDRPNDKAQNWPFTLLDYWQRTLRPDPDDFEITSQ